MIRLPKIVRVELSLARQLVIWTRLHEPALKYPRLGHARFQWGLGEAPLRLQVATKRAPM